MREVLTAQLAEWNADRGFGFLRFGSRRIFLHASDFSGAQSDLKIGEMFHFEMGADERGRARAVRVSIVRPAKSGRKESRKHTSPVGLRWLDAACVAALLALPVISILYRDFDWRITLAWAVSISVFTFAAYGHDKRRAENGGWRVPERSLHILELFGGWPGAFLAQRRYRHKSSKLGYQSVFWLIVLGYQFVAFDSLNEWRICKWMTSAK